MPRLLLYLAACLPFLSLLPPRASTQCELFPKSTCKKHTAFVPGHNLAGEGFDITTLQKTGTYVVDTNRWQYLNGMCVLCRNPLMGGQLQRLPLAGVDWQAHVTCHRHGSSSVEYSYVAVANALAKEVKNSGKIELNLLKEMAPVNLLKEMVPIFKAQAALAGSHSQMVNYAHEKAQEDRYSFVRQEVSCEYYRLRLLPAPKHLSIHFSRAVKKLSSDYDPEEYRHLIETYGTHYLSQIQLGGRVRNLVAVQTCQATWAGITESAIMNCMNLEASLSTKWGSASLSTQCSERQKNQARTMFSEGHSQWRTEVVGGDSQVKLLFAKPEEVPLFSEWAEKAKTHPGVVSYFLQPVHTLIDKKDPKRKMLREAVRDYIAERALLRNCTQRCPGRSFPSSKDPCTCVCEPDAITNTMCCARERGLARFKLLINRGYGLWADGIFTGSDAYVRVFFQQQERRTISIPDNNDPWWTQPLDFGPVKLSGYNYMVVQIWDQDPWHDELLATCEVTLVAGRTVWGTCHPQYGYVDFYYVLECGPGLGGPTCHNHVPQKQR